MPRRLNNLSQSDWFRPFRRLFSLETRGHKRFRGAVLGAILSLAGCATTTSEVGQVREVAPGTYKIGVARGTSSVVFGSNEAANTAVSQAGEFCHAKGQKLVIVPGGGKDVNCPLRREIAL
jgi:hypothetical protein